MTEEEIEILKYCLHLVDDMLDRRQFDTVESGVNFISTVYDFIQESKR